jgi:hypothetical protein
MLRAMFFATGTFAALCGAVLFRVDRVVLTRSADDVRIVDVIGRSLPDSRCEIDPPEWLAYTLVSTGVLTMLYALALPKKGT